MGGAESNLVRDILAKIRPHVLRWIGEYFEGNVGKDYLIEVKKGNVLGSSMVHKFGSGSVGTTMVPVTVSNVYQTPTTAQALELVSSSGQDTPGGTGALEVVIQGLDANWEQVTQTVTTGGTIALPIPTNLIRLYRWYVSSSGTYATSGGGSHVGTLTIRASGGGATWSQIPVSPFPIGQSLIGAYTVPAGKTAYLMGWDLHADTSKSVSAILFQRPLADDVTTPYSGGMRTISYKVGVAGDTSDVTRGPRGGFVGPCDIGVMAAVSVGSADVSTDFELLVVDD